MTALKNLKQRLINFTDEAWDQHLKVSTFGYHPGSGEQGKPGWQIHYIPAPYARIFQCFELAGLGRRDTFVDLGSGLGRAVFAASYYGAKKAVGVEIVDELVEHANKNREGYPDVEFYRMNASDFDFAGTTVIFMFHPFGEDTVRAVVEKLKGLHDLRIIYMNPICEHVLNAAPWLEPFATLPEEKRLASTWYPVKFWCNKRPISSPSAAS